MLCRRTCDYLPLIDMHPRAQTHQHSSIKFVRANTRDRYAEGVIERARTFLGSCARKLHALHVRTIAEQRKSGPTHELSGWTSVGQGEVGRVKTEMDY